MKKRIWKYTVRLIVYFFAFFLSFSLFSVLLLRVIPVTVTPYKIVRLVGNLQEHGMSVKTKWTSIDKISPSMIRAVVASEDGKFLTHRGFDMDAIKKAREENKKGKRLRGASTISQQTAKNVFCTYHRNWLRKGMETWFTILIETFWDKKRIMEVYLNVIEIRPGMYGVGSAAKLVYNTKASGLGDYETSMIAMVLPNPYTMNIYKPSSYMLKRSEKIRSMMRNVGNINFENTRKKKKSNNKLQ